MCIMRCMRTCKPLQMLIFTLYMTDDWFQKFVEQKKYFPWNSLHHDKEQKKKQVAKLLRRKKRSRSNPFEYAILYYIRIHYTNSIFCMHYCYHNQVLWILYSRYPYICRTHFGPWSYSYHTHTQNEVKMFMVVSCHAFCFNTFRLESNICKWFDSVWHRLRVLHLKNLYSFMRNVRASQIIHYLIVYVLSLRDSPESV